MDIRTLPLVFFVPDIFEMVGERFDLFRNLLELPYLLRLESRGVPAETLSYLDKIVQFTLL